VLSVYLDEVVPKQARPAKVAARMERLINWWGDKMLADVGPSTCRAYAAVRKRGGSRRDLRTCGPPSTTTTSADFTTALSRSSCRRGALRERRG
jgi:hypothetical protein